MNSRAGVSEAQKDAPSRSVIPVSSSLLQRKCACGGSPGVTGNCSECEEKRLSVQRHAISRRESAIGRNTRRDIQTKLSVSEPGDKFEREADRIADAVMQRSAGTTEVVGERDEDEVVQTKLVGDITPLIQRQMEGEEEEEEEEETVQTKRSSNETSLITEEEEDDKVDQLAASLKQAKGSGIPLPDNVRANMEKAFGVDFRQVRIHFDRAAHELSHSLHASAFTTGTDIFFREGTSDLASNSGRRLLAHELTHVVQQNPQVRVRSPSTGEGKIAPQSDRFKDPHTAQLPQSIVSEVIQRADPPAEGEPSKVFIGRLQVRKRGGTVYSYKVFHSSFSPLKVGKFSARITGEPPNAQLKAGGKVFEITDLDWEDFNEKSKGATLRLVITVERPRAVEKGGKAKKDSTKDKPSEGTGEGTPKKTKGGKTAGGEGEGETEGEVGDKEKGVEGGEGESDQAPGDQLDGGETDQEPGEESSGEKGPEGEGGGGDGGGGEKAPPQTPTDTEPPGEPGAETAPAQETEEEISGEEEVKQESEEGEVVLEGGAEGGKKGGAGKGTEPGSKYGWLGLVHPDPAVIAVLTEMYDLLDGSGELGALSNLLKNLEEFDSHAAEIRSWFGDSEKLLRVVLGLETNQAITALETWVDSGPERPRRKLRSPGRGLAGILKKVMRILEAVRRSLKPVFNTRKRFLEAFEAAGDILDEIPVFEQLVEETAKPGSPQFEGMLDELTNDFTKGIQSQLSAAQATFKAKIEKLDETELLTSEDIARAIVSAARKALPPHARLGAKVLDEIGLLEPTAEHVVGPMIPEEVLNGINGILKEMFSGLEPVFEDVEKVMDEVISTTNSVLKDELAPVIKDVFMPQRPSPSTGFAPRNELGLLNLMRRSRGQALEANLRREMTSTMGFDFGSVRIHHDFAAQRANEMVQANAFTVGRDIFFGPGKFAPETDPGSRLLAHELTHVVQQGQGLPGEIVQRAAKGIPKELVGKYQGFLEEAKRFKANPQKKAEAAEIRAQVESLISKPFSTVEKKLPHVYIVIRKKPRKILIRRKRGWTFLVPKLHVVRHRLELNLLRKHDPKAVQRRELRAALGCSRKEEAHHIIPLELVPTNELCKLAKAQGFNFNSWKNGVCLSKKLHSGSHKRYTQAITEELEALILQHKQGSKLVWTEELEQDFYELLGRIRANLKRRKTKLK